MLHASYSDIHVLPSLFLFINISWGRRYSQELRATLAQHAKRLCDQIEQITQLQTTHRVTLVPNIYRITNVSKSEQVECKSLLPAWMTGSKRCLGGACLSCPPCAPHREIQEL
ncbi:hypothetical protein AHF37_12358 [Paragonimus kellicotti]|nr:hypothetical protein AHF37_12358 [Paragonimus kellicotti]